MARRINQSNVVLLENRDRFSGLYALLGAELKGFLPFPSLLSSNTGQFKFSLGLGIVINSLPLAVDS